MADAVQGEVESVNSGANIESVGSRGMLISVIVQCYSNNDWYADSFYLQIRGINGFFIASCKKRQSV
jgi:hypothetical protein